MRVTGVVNMKVPIGGVIEIPVGGRFAYALITHKHDDYHELIRVFCGLYDKQQKDFSVLINREVCFSCFTSLKYFIKDGCGSIVGVAGIPKKLKDFPLFRTGMQNPATGKVDNWWLWDGVKEWRVGGLEPEQYKLPIRGVYGGAVIVKYIQEGWRPETAGW